ncbi:MAG: glycosyltransferase family 2 protein [Bacteroidia bacterium]
MLQFKTPEYVKKLASLAGDPDRVSSKTYAQIAASIQKLQSPNPEVTILIIAFNEEENLLPTLASLAATESPYRTELLAVNNNSSDRTQEILDRCGVKNVFEKRQGIGWARQRGLESASAPIVVNGDADSIYPPTWSAFMAKPLQDSTVAVVYSRYSFIPGSSGNTAYLRLHESVGASIIALRRRRADSSNVMGFSFAFRKDDAMGVGGFPVNGKHRWEDGLLVHKLHKTGSIHLVRDPEARVWTSDRRLLMDGSYFRAFLSRAKRHLRYMPDYLFFKNAEL